MVRSRNRMNRRLQSRRFPIRGRGGMRGRNRKIVVLNRRPRRNVPKRMPVLGYAAGGTSTTFRAYIKTYQIPANQTEFSDVYSFSLAEAFAHVESTLKLIPSLYTNFQLHRVTFRVLSTVGSSIGGVNCGLVLDKSMAVPIASALDYKDMISRGGSTSGKLWQDLALEWVPTEPDDLNYKDSKDQAMAFAYSAFLAKAFNAATNIGILVADVYLVARTLNTTAEFFSTLGPMNELEGRAIARDRVDRLSDPISVDRVYDPDSPTHNAI